jgi:hypothetical protein
MDYESYSAGADLREGAARPPAWLKPLRRGEGPAACSRVVYGVEPYQGTTATGPPSPRFRRAGTVALLFFATSAWPRRGTRHVVRLGVSLCRWEWTGETCHVSRDACPTVQGSQSRVLVGRHTAHHSTSTGSRLPCETHRGIV